MFRRILVISILFSNMLYASETIILANGEWAPYQSPKLKQYGYISQIVKEAFAEEGYRVKYLFLPWIVGYEGAKEGKYDGSLIWGYSKEREESFYFSDTLAVLGTSLFHLAGKSIQWDQLSDLSKYRIGGVIGYSYGIDALERAGVVKVDRIVSADRNYEKLLNGELDIVLEDTEVGLESLERLGLEGDVSKHTRTFQARNYSVIISKKSPRAEKLLDAFNAGLKKMIADGRYDQYLQASRRGEYKK